MLKAMKDEMAGDLKSTVAAEEAAVTGLSRGSRRDQIILYSNSGLVLICKGSYDSEARRILQHFSRSTRF